MKQISIQDLKARLSGAVAEAAAGETIIVTRHNQPIARLTSAGADRVHRGRLVGTGRLRPAIKRGTNGRYLKALAEDRDDR